MVCNKDRVAQVLSPYIPPILEIIRFCDEHEVYVQDVWSSNGEHWTGYYDLENPDQPTV